MGQYFFISRVPQATFFDAVREAAMEAIRQIGEILEARLRYTQEYLRVCLVLVTRWNVTGPTRA